MTSHGVPQSTPELIEKLSEIQLLPLENKNGKKSVRFHGDFLVYEHAKHGDLDAMITLWQENPSMSANMSHPNSGLSLLHLACAYGHLQLVQYLLDEKHADINIVDREGWTSLHCCIAEVPLEGPKRARFLIVLEDLLRRDALQMSKLTKDGESVFDVIREDEDTGDVDEEVLDILQKAADRLGIFPESEARSTWTVEAPSTRVVPETG